MILLAGTQIVAGQQEGGDTFYSNQWHLKNTGQGGDTTGEDIGEDINVEPVWKKQLKGGNTLVRGQGIYISIVDGDLPIERQSINLDLMAHPDLIENISTQHSVDYYPSLTDTSSHATAVAGLAAARGYNNIGVRGVAPRATIYSLNILGIPSTGMSVNVSEVDIADAMVRHKEITAVSNNSWGPINPFSPRGNRYATWAMAIKTGITKGFDGKGTVYVWAAGNDRCFRRDISTSATIEDWQLVCNKDNSNYDGRANHHASVTVCSVDSRGKHSLFSEFGANLWVCAPSGTLGFNPTDGIFTPNNGIVTTFRSNRYTYGFTGTSASAPMVSGVVALMRQVNPDLSWRDVKLILANSARQNDPMDDGWEQGALKYGKTEEKYHFNHKYGFGVVDAYEAVKLAEDWVNLPSRLPNTAVQNSNIDVGNTIDVNNPVVSNSISVQSDINFIEYVDIPIIFSHPLIQDLSVKLISPSGTTSNLMIPSTHPLSSTGTYTIGATGFLWPFGSAKHLGEDPEGIWSLHFEDTRGTTGTLISWGLNIRGYQIKMDATPVVGLSDSNIDETPLTLSLRGAKWKENLTLSDFRLKNAPAGLIINKVVTSDTQVVQLELALNENLTANYLFQVEATTGTVSNRTTSLVSNEIEIKAQIKVREDVVIPEGAAGSDYTFTMADIFTSSQTLSYTILIVDDMDTVLPDAKIDGLTITGPSIRGKPKTAGTYRLKVTATTQDGKASTTRFFVLRILPYTIRIQLRAFLEGALGP